MKLLLLALLLLLSCTPVRVVTPSPGLPLCAQACKMEAELDCSEGKSPTCTPDCERLSRLGYVWMDDKSGPECVVKSAGTVEAVRACNVRCE
jgi:hypothetical protein